VNVASLISTEDAKRLLVNGHIVYGAYTKSNLQDGMTLQALNGAVLEVYKTPSGTVFVENMEIRGSSDGTTVTTNGVNSIVHDVNDVNIPNVPNSRRTIFQALAAKPSKFLSFKLAILRSGNNGILSQISSTSAMYTVIAPTNDQLTGSVLDPATITALDDARLANTLKYHLVQGEVDLFNQLNNSQVFTADGRTINVMFSNPPCPGGGTDCASLFMNNVPIAKVTAPYYTASSNGRFYEGSGSTNNMLLVPPELRTISQQLVSYPAQFTILSAAVASAAFNQLGGTTNYTLFAPVDSAWAALGYSYNTLPGSGATNTLQEFLQMHVVSGYFRADEAFRGLTTAAGSNTKTLTMLNGATTTLYMASSSASYIANARIIGTDTIGTNGVVHYIDAVIIPPSQRTTLQTLQAFPALYSTLTSAIVAAGLSSTFSDVVTPRTLFAPVNSAFANYGSRITDLLNDAAIGLTADLQLLLSYHAVNGRSTTTALYPESGGFSSSLDTLAVVNDADAKIKFVREVAASGSGFTFFVDGAKLNGSVSNLQTSNGMIQSIDDVLWPPSMRNLYQVISADRGRFRTLERAVIKAGMKDTLATAEHTLIAFDESTLAASNSLLAFILPLITSTKPADLKTLQDYLSYGLTDSTLVFGTSSGANGITAGSKRPNTCASTSCSAFCASCGTDNGNNNLEVTYPTGGALPSVDNQIISGQVAAGSRPANRLAGTGNLVTLRNAILIPPKYRNIQQVISSQPTAFSQLLGYMNTASYTQLGCMGSAVCNYTFFAANNAAFAKASTVTPVPRANDVTTLTNLLQYHAVPAYYQAADLIARFNSNGGAAFTLDTVQGSSLEVTVIGGSVFVNNMKVSSVFDVAATNGIVHYVDNVAIPPTQRNALQRIQASPSQFSYFDMLLNKANPTSSIYNTIATSNFQTIFVPTDAAFAAVWGQVQAYYVAANPNDLVNLLNYHIFRPSGATASNVNPVWNLTTPSGFTTGTTLTMTNTASSPANVQIKSVSGQSQVFIDIAQIVVDPNYPSGFPATSAGGSGQAQVHTINAVLFPQSLRNVAEVVMANTPVYYTLGTGLQLAGLVPTVSSSTEYTIFAPMDAAFAAADVSALGNQVFADALIGNPTRLRNLLSYHIVKGRVTSGQLTNGATFTSVLGDTLTVSVTSSGGSTIYRINDAKLTNVAAPVSGTNGLIYQIENVLLPQSERSVYAVVKSNPFSYSTMQKYIDAAGLVAQLNGNDPFTLFLVVNADISLTSYSSLIEPLYTQAIATPTPNTTALNNFVSYMLIKEKVYANQLVLGTRKSALGEAINIRRGTDGTTVYLNEATVVTSDIMATNGVVHVIDRPLFPSFQRTSLSALTANQGTYSTLIAAATSQGACTGVQPVAAALSNPTFGGTLFAPNNDAFTAFGTLPTTPTGCAKLDALLKYHVVSTRYALTDLVSGMKIATLSPVVAPPNLGRRLLQSTFETLTVWRPTNSSDVYVNNAKIIGVDSTSNGNVLQLDAVVIPPSQQDVVQVAQARPASFSSLVAFIQAAGMTSSLKKALDAKFTGFTIFAPTDGAFAASPFLKDFQALVAAAKAGTQGGLQELLWNHVVYGVWPTPLVSGTVMRSINGLEISITTSDGSDGRTAGTYANSVLISDVAGVQATNGRVHTVAGVISGQLAIPSSAIVPTSISRTPQGICPEYGSILRNSANKVMATATIKLAPDLQTATMTVTSQSGALSELSLRGPDASGLNTQFAVPQFDDYKSACNADSTKCLSVITLTIPMSSLNMKNMDARSVTLFATRFNVSDTTAATLSGTVPRFGCYEATLGALSGGTAKGTALAMVDDTAATYAFGATNSNNQCPSGTSSITTAAQCQLAAAALRIATDPIVSSGTNSDGSSVAQITGTTWPQGCFFYEGTDASGASSTAARKVYFANRTVGTAGVPLPYVGTQKPLCVATSSDAGGIIFQVLVKDLPTGASVNLIRVIGDISDPNLEQSYEANLKVALFDSSDPTTANVDAGLTRLNQPFVYTGTDVSRFVQGFQIGSYALDVRFSTSTTAGATVGYFYPAVSCPSLTGFALGKYLTFKTGDPQTAQVLTQARLDTYYREVLISVRVIKPPTTGITSVDIMGPAALGSDADTVRLSIKGDFQRQPIIQKRFRLTAMDIVNFQQGLMYANVRTVRYPNGELRGQYDYTTCYSVTIAPPNSVDAGNTVFGQIQVSPDGTEAFINVFGNGIPGANASKPFELKDDRRISLLNADLPHLDSQPKATALLLPGAKPDPLNLGEMPLTKTFGVTQILRDSMLLGQVSLAAKVASSISGTTVTATAAQASFRVAVVPDPRKYVVQDGDTLESIAAANKFDSWVPLQMINRLSAPYNLVQGQVLDLCYKHRVAASETIYDIARKYGLSYTELYPMNPHLFDSEFIFAGQEVCVMPAMKRIMCGAPARVADSTGLRGSQGRASSGDSTSSFSVGATW